MTAFGSHGVRVTRILSRSSANLVCMRVEPGGVIGAHPAAVNQLFLVVEGAGWVRSGSSAPVDIQVGQAAFWEAGEVHESGTATGLVAVIVEGLDLQPELPVLASAR